MIQKIKNLLNLEIEIHIHTRHVIYAVALITATILYALHNAKINSLENTIKVKELHIKYLEDCLNYHLLHD